MFQGFLWNTGRHDCYRSRTSSRRALFAALGDIIKCLAAHGGDRGRRSEHDQYLLLGGTDGDIFESAFGHHVAALVDLGEVRASAQQETEHRSGDQWANAIAPARRAMKKFVRHRHFTLASDVRPGVPEALLACGLGRGRLWLCA